MMINFCGNVGNYTLSIPLFAIPPTKSLQLPEINQLHERNLRDTIVFLFLPRSSNSLFRTAVVEAPQPCGCFEVKHA